ncbi:class I adenylate-forming enzyme family protein [Aeromicrobium piscarium]|uniref:AMP-binding protein n=1 Tax=Aeromicrobium piscarium TaxID=2590901 RepID=A0A554SFK9_9ACTN|nr:AMP-binding protein [Aeromicrobium piscarium]TSD65139.1 AMP-binding protein [Aeromicrobium piscarium]
MRQHFTISEWAVEGPHPLIETTVPELLEQTADDAGERIALVDGHPDPLHRHRWTYAELLDEARLAASALNRRFAPGDRVALWGANRPEAVFAQLGAALAGIIVVTVNPQYRERELLHLLRQSRAAGILHDPTFRGADLGAMIASIRADLPELHTTWHVDELRDRAEPQALSSTTRSPTAPGDPYLLIYTSGTTGVAKGALLHHRGVVNAPMAFARRAGFHTGDTWINTLPLFHTSGAVMAVIGSIAMRSRHVLMPHFDAGLFLDLVETEQGTLSVMVPTMISAVLNEIQDHPRDTRSLRTIAVGGAGVPPLLCRRARAALGCEVSVVYGQTEVHGVITQTRPSDSEEDQAESIGQPLPGVELKIVGPDGAPVPVGGPGELCTRGYQTMLGYFDMPSATDDTVDAEGWLHSGDIAVMDARGYVAIRGRSKDLIIRGGENIHPQEIEHVLESCDAVAEAAVLGRPDDHWGEIVVAAIVPRPGQDASPERLHAHCRAQLAAFKTPQQWHLVAELPRTPSGKVMKHVLREQLD